MPDLAMHKMALDRVPFALVISHPKIDGNPIVFVNQAFSSLIGYSPEASIGRNCRFRQGADTDPQAIAAIRAGLESGADVSVELVNHRADGD
jgi:PAS domain-containing protein